MDNVNYYPKALLTVVTRRLLAHDPFMLFDIGCGLGIDPVWRCFGKDLHAHGFDPQEDECAKLVAQEKNSNVHYHAAFVGLSPSDPFHQGGLASAQAGGSYFAPGDQLARSSSYAAGRRTQGRATAPPASSLESTEQWKSRRLSTRTLAISEFVTEQGISSIDFVKIDTDGRDLEAAASCRDAIRHTNILGFMIECFFAGSDDETQNSFHNVDAFMRRNGFVLYTLTVNRYSRAALPAPFLYPAFYQTVSGQAVWGDMVYFRDGASMDYRTVWGEDLSVTKLLKLACLYELFNLQDCAAELVVVHRDRLRTVIDPRLLLDLLTPRLHNVDRTYEEYIKLFESDAESFFPGAKPSSGVKTSRHP